jgi:hypothetical protein
MHPECAWKAAAGDAWTLPATARRRRRSAYKRQGEMVLLTK